MMVTSEGHLKLTSGKGRNENAEKKKKRCTRIGFKGIRPATLKG
jgi:hypothetical protein